MTVARVVLASPLPQLDRPFEYRVPDALEETIGVGCRIRVPLRTGGRSVEAYVLELLEEASFTGKLAEVTEVVSAVPVLTEQVAELSRRVADRQAGVMADVLRLAIPARSARQEAAWLERRREPDAASRSQSTEQVPKTPVADVVASSYAAESAAVLTHPSARIALETPAGVSNDGVPAGLDVLAQLASERVEAGNDAILAVPDFRDVERAVAALRKHLPDERIRRFDARQKPAARSAEFLRALEGQPGVNVGTRSVMFSPAARLGAILVWDDGDDSFIEPLAPYAHARDVALIRQDLTGAALIFAATTPSPEVARLVRIGFLSPISPNRKKRASVIISGSAMNQDDRLLHARIPTIAWRAAREALDSGPVLVQVARAGYLPALGCASCFERATCRICGGALKLDGPASVPVCAVCAALSAPWECLVCGGHQLRRIAIGADRTAEELGRAFPGARVLVADAEHENTRLEGNTTKTLVVATRGAEPVPPGGYAAALLLDGERMLAREGLDVAVETLRGWSNTAALVAPAGRVIVAGSAHPVAAALRDGRHAEFVAQEVLERAELGFPPAIRVARVSGTSAEVNDALTAIRAADPALSVLGPVSGESGEQVATIRFAYSAGAEVARAAKSHIVKVATSSRPRTKSGPRRSASSSLRIRFDPPHAF